MLTLIRLALLMLRLAFRGHSDLMLENLALRHQLAVLTRQPSRPRLLPADRVFWSWLSRLWTGWRTQLVIVQPATVIGWHRSAWRRYWTWKSRGPRPGRPRIDSGLQQLIRRLTRENPRWGHMRVLGELRKLGFRVSLQTVRRYRKDVPRSPDQGWHTFLVNHRREIWAADFFTVHTLTLKTLYVFFLIGHDRRTLIHLNVTDHPTATWVWRQVIEATPWGEQPRFLVRDRDRAYGPAFVPHAHAIGIETVLTPIATPQANGVAERLVGTLRRECLDHVLVVNERHLRSVLLEFARYYNEERPHRTLALAAPRGSPVPLQPADANRVRATAVLGGLHHTYAVAA